METTRKTVLIIEDSAYLQESLRDLVELNGHTALTTNSGTEGVALALQHHPDLIFLDIRLPDINGYEVFTQIKADPTWGQKSQIVILTASESTDTVSQRLELPPEDVMFKQDWSMQDLTKVLEAKLR